MVGDLVAEALEIDGGAEVVALARMVEDGVDDDGDARAVQGLDHVAELADVASFFGRDAVAGLRREETDRAVAPVVHKRAAAVGIHPQHFLVVVFHHRQQFDGVDAQVLEVRNLLDDGRERAGMFDARGRMPREAADVHLVDHHLVDRPVERAIALPVVVGHVDDHAAQRRGQIVAGPAGVGPIPERIRIAAAVGVDEDFVGVEAKALAVQVGGAVNAIGVVGARLQSLDVHVPEEKGLVHRRVELDRLHRLAIVVRIEQQQLDGRGVAREDREVHAGRIGDCAKGWAWPGVVVYREEVMVALSSNLLVSRLADFQNRSSCVSRPKSAPYFVSTRNKNSLFGSSASLTHSFVHRISAITFFL